MLMLCLRFQLEKIVRIINEKQLILQNKNQMSIVFFANIDQVESRYRLVVFDVDIRKIDLFVVFQIVNGCFLDTKRNGCRGDYVTETVVG